MEPNAGPKWLLENVTAKMASRKSRVLCRRAEATSASKYTYTRSLVGTLVDIPIRLRGWRRGLGFEERTLSGVRRWCSLPVWAPCSPLLSVKAQTTLCQMQQIK